MIRIEISEHCCRREINFKKKKKKNQQTNSLLSLSDFQIKKEKTSHEHKNVSLKFVTREISRRDAQLYLHVLISVFDVQLYN